MRRKRKIPIILTPEEVEKIIAQPNEKYLTGLRNKAILSFIWIVALGYLMSLICAPVI